MRIDAVKVNPQLGEGALRDFNLGHLMELPLAGLKCICGKPLGHEADHSICAACGLVLLDIWIGIMLGGVPSLLGIARQLHLSPQLLRSTRECRYAQHPLQKYPQHTSSKDQSLVLPLLSPGMSPTRVRSAISPATPKQERTMSICNEGTAITVSHKYMPFHLAGAASSHA